MGKTIGFGTIVRSKRGHETFMVLDTKPSEKKGQPGSWYKAIRLSTGGRSSLVKHHIGQIAFVPQASVTKQDEQDDS